MKFQELDLYSQDYAFRILVQDIEEKTIKLDPIFQRTYKWDKDNNERWSKFIESCFMRIPLPSCYFREVENGTFDVIDWVQRLTTIKNFLNNNFELEGLSVFPELNGKKFKDLNPVYQTDLKNYTIRCIILRRTNPEDIVNEIFARLNQGSVVLSAQEIRKALYHWNFYKLLVRLWGDSRIKKLASTKANDLYHHELVLRFFCMSDNNLLRYNDRLQEYLNNFIIKNKNATSEKIEEYEALFLETLDSAYQYFGTTPFSNINNKRKKDSIAIYDLIMRFCRNYKDILPSLENIPQKMQTFFESEEYLKTISWGIVQKSNIQKRRNLLLKHLWL